MDALYNERWWDPYNRNRSKGDKPIHGDDWFFNITAFSDTVADFRNVATPVGCAELPMIRARPTCSGGMNQFGFTQNLGAELVYYKGDTVFRPPDYEFRLTPVINYNYTQRTGASQSQRRSPRRDDPPRQPYRAAGGIFRLPHP
ncbi:MAG: hypothetical protein U5O39_20805 [Gammaproteobacteria bacterium]|nr:hypothetical protein [Gammaproteobacteria bacterium]